MGLQRNTIIPNPVYPTFLFVNPEFWRFLNNFARDGTVRINGTSYGVALTGSKRYLFLCLVLPSAGIMDTWLLMLLLSCDVLRRCPCRNHYQVWCRKGVHVLWSLSVSLLSLVLILKNELLNISISVLVKTFNAKQLLFNCHWWHEIHG